LRGRLKIRARSPVLLALWRACRSSLPMPAAMASSRSWVACWQMSAAHELECPLTFH
jgi:hypothetical protein